ncbi:MAG: amino acid ABC transporter substrate-binding protein [Clostridiaceae bacterium]|nr:amino acid ABC transporter substrate-binding protein [Clostridiaceae bacterium]
MKRKSYVKVLILLQVICLILILLPGCSQKVDSSGKDSSPNVVDVPVATDAPVQQTQQSTSNSSSISVSLPIIPPLITEQKTGAIVELVKAMADEYKDGEMTFDVYPMARSMENIMSGSADAHCPYVKNHNITDSDNMFYYTTEPFGSVIFVLYTNKNVKDLTPENVLDKKFKVEIQPGHKEYLGDLPEAAPDAGLQKVDSGRIDGYIATMSMCDQMVKAMQLKNIKRQKFDTFETAIIFKKDDNGKQKRDIMNTLIKKIRENGEYDRIMGEINSKEVFIPDEQ